MEPRWADLQRMTEAELVELYDRIAGNTQVGLDFVRQALSEKQVARQTRTLVNLTIVIAVLTVINTVFADCS